MTHTPDILDYLDRAAAEMPHKTAVADEHNSICFRDLQGQVYALAARLRSEGFSGGPVGVYAGRKLEVVAAMLAVAAAGGCYVPLNPLVPAEKNKKIIRSAGLKLLIGSEAGDYDGAEEGCRYISYDHKELPGCFCRPAVEIRGSDTLCIVYTSGSTGEPKGIRKSHGSVVDFTEAYVKEFGFTADEVIGNQSPFSADASAKDLFVMLRTGARLEIIPSKLFSFPAQLMEYLNEREISFISWVPSALAIVARLRTFRDVMPRTLKRVYFVGEVFPARDLEGWRTALPELDYVNLYGSSELAGICCYYRLPKGEAVPEALPIGAPLGNSRIYLLRDGKLSTDGSGEIAVASGALADEYIGDAAKTAATFIEMEIDGEICRLLRTGDMARYDEEGKLVYVSRDDGMIKYKGYRIELGEIEAAVSALDVIVRACCLYDARRERITVFASARQPELKLRELNEMLADRLPDYMLPRRLVLMDELPLNPNGKIDRAGLKELL